MLPDFRTELRKLQITRAFTPQVQTPENKINELKEGELVPIAIDEKDTQTDVLRKAYAEYAKRAGLSDVAGFAKSMVKDGEVIWHEDGITTFSVTEFEAKRPAGTINMIPGKGDLAAARQARVEELLHCSLFDCSVTADEQKQIVDVLKNDPNLSETIKGLDKKGFLPSLISRVHNESRRELIDVLGRGLNQETSELVLPHIEKLDVTIVPATADISKNLWQVRFNLARMGVSPSTGNYDSALYSDVVSKNPLAPFTGVGATGINPAQAADEVSLLDIIGAGLHKKGIMDFPESFDKLNKPGMSWDMPPRQRLRQVEVLLNQPINTSMPELYGDKRPSRADIIRLAAEKYNLEPELLAGFILAEQRDQKRLEDGKDFKAAVVFGADTSIGLGQVKISNIKKHDLFSDLMTEKTRNNLSQTDSARMLSSDEVNIFATAKYLRKVADMGANAETRAKEAARPGVYDKPPVQNLSRTQKALPNLKLEDYSKHSREWSEDNIRMLGSEYTSSPWDNDLHLRSEVLGNEKILEGQNLSKAAKTREEKEAAGAITKQGNDLLDRNWGDFVLEAYKDVKRSNTFPK